MMLDALSAPLLQARAAELDEATRVTYRLEQTFRYSYSAPVTDLRHRLVVMPPARHGEVHRRLATLTVSGLDDAAGVTRADRRDGVTRADRRDGVTRADRRDGVDRDGNEVTQLHAERVEEHVEFRLAAVLERVTGAGDVVLPAGALTDARWVRPTALTTPDAAVLELAESLRGPAGEHPLATAERVCSAVHARFTYRFGVTGVRTTAAEALAGGVGVCQDYAQVMIAVMRHLAIPTRYVSGHLIGQGGTHAWVDVLLPAGSRRGGRAAATAVAFDPCNDKRAGAGHLTIAVGRDYTDVAPTSGSFSGEGVTGSLASTRDLGVVRIEA